MVTKKRSERESGSLPAQDASLGSLVVDADGRVVEKVLLDGPQQFGELGGVHPCEGGVVQPAGSPIVRLGAVLVGRGQEGGRGFGPETVVPGGVPVMRYQRQVAMTSSGTWTPVGYWPGSNSAWTVGPVLVVTAPMVLTTTSWLVSGRPR